MTVAESIDEIDEDELFENLTNAFDCTKLRIRINKFLATKEMTQTMFLKTIGANSNSFRNFMKYTGKYQGIGNQTFRGGAEFFYRRDLLARKQPKTSVPGPSKKDLASNEKKLLEKVESVELPESGPVYDDCDQVRTSIMTFLNSKAMTQTAFCKYLNANSNSLRQFLGFKGKDKGAGHGIYHKAFRFFERLRIANGEPKSKARIKNEKEHPNGFSLEAPPKLNVTEREGEVDFSNFKAPKPNRLAMQDGDLFKPLALKKIREEYESTKAKLNITDVALEPSTKRSKFLPSAFVGNELDQYLAEPRIETDVLKYWSQRQYTWPGTNRDVEGTFTASPVAQNAGSTVSGPSTPEIQQNWKRDFAKLGPNRNEILSQAQTAISRSNIVPGISPIYEGQGFGTITYRCGPDSKFGSFPIRQHMVIGPPGNRAILDLGPQFIRKDGFFTSTSRTGQEIRQGAPPGIGQITHNDGPILSLQSFKNGIDDPVNPLRNGRWFGFSLTRVTSSGSGVLERLSRGYVDIVMGGQKPPSCANFGEEITLNIVGTYHLSL